MQLSALIPLAIAISLSGCYIVPIDGRYPPPVAHPSGDAPAPPALPITLQARLYPLNDVAGKMGVLSASVTDSLNGHGSFSLTTGNEVLQGEASRVPNDHPGFGAVHRQVYGDNRYPSGGRRGIANAGGNRGTYLNCEYVLTAAARGTGACLFSNGAKYQMHFGG